MHVEDFVLEACAQDGHKGGASRAPLGREKEHHNFASERRFRHHSGAISTLKLGRQDVRHAAPGASEMAVGVCRECRQRTLFTVKIFRRRSEKTGRERGRACGNEGMGTGASKISACKNDFELVIRATKELEWLLETHFSAPSGKTVGLHEKITAARNPQDGKPLPNNIQKRMRYLVTIRNQLVHDREVNAIPDRTSFAAGWDEVERELQAMMPATGSSCMIS